jgi:hypothetical protein
MQLRSRRLVARQLRGACAEFRRHLESKPETRPPQHDADRGSSEGVPHGRRRRQTPPPVVRPARRWHRTAPEAARRTREAVTQWVCRPGRYAETPDLDHARCELPDNLAAIGCQLVIVSSPSFGRTPRYWASPFSATALGYVDWGRLVRGDAGAAGPWSHQLRRLAMQRLPTVYGGCRT